MSKSERSTWCAKVSTSAGLRGGLYGSDDMGGSCEPVSVAREGVVPVVAGGSVVTTWKNAQSDGAAQLTWKRVVVAGKQRTKTVSGAVGERAMVVSRRMKTISEA